MGEENESDFESSEVLGNSPEDGPKLIVGLGASAGGLEALTLFFEQVPADSGMCFVVVQHLAADQKSHMADLLGRRSAVPVQFATDSTLLRANEVIVMPNDKHLAVEGMSLRLLPRDNTGDFRDNLPIDTFLESLAEHQPHRSVAVILSGTGSDGTRGLRAVKEAGGLVVVQDIESAKFDGMPRSAAATGLADIVLTPGEMPEYLVSYSMQTTPVVKSDLFSNEERLTSLLEYLAAETGIDFNDYKRSTVVRRIQRRMGVTQVDNIDQYDALLRQSKREVELLRSDLLIHVTAFLRDPVAWSAFSDQVAELIRECDSKEGLRFWVTACATGEEAYTLAIVLEQAFERLNQRVPYKVFASDVDASAVDRAGSGSYPLSIAGDLPADLLSRYFVKTGSEYVIVREIRERIIFAQHNLISDPPFAKMDMVTCRNLLIYLSPEVQARVISVFQFALRRGGLLLLGSSESIARHFDAFDVIDSKWKLFRNRQRSLRLLDDMSMIDPLADRRTSSNKKGTRRDARSQFLGSLQSELIESCLPPTVVVDGNRTIVQTYGDVNDFLRIPVGEPTLDVVKMAEGELSILLATAVSRVVTTGEDLVFNNVAFSRVNEGRVRVTVRRIEGATRDRSLAAILFDRGLSWGLRDNELVEEDYDDARRSRITDLERDLQYTRESLQATVEELETTNEELQASNEELVASNEELQSTNEELHSVNEELHTMNSEFQSKIEELTIANDDFTNLMQATSVGAIFLDDELRIRRFTDASREVIGLVPGDLGRRIDTFKWQIRGRDMSKAAQDVLNSRQELRFAVHDVRNTWYWTRVQPYAAVDSTAAGVVITFVDITDEHIAERHYSDLASLSIGVSLPIVIVDVDGRIHYANRAFGSATGLDSTLAADTGISDVVDAEVGLRLKRSITERVEWSGLATCSRHDGSVFWATTKISPVEEENGQPALAVLTFEEIRSVPPSDVN